MLVSLNCGNVAGNIYVTFLSKLTVSVQIDLSGVAICCHPNVWMLATAQGDRQAGGDENEHFRSQK